MIRRLKGDAHLIDPLAQKMSGFAELYAALLRIQADRKIFTFRLSFGEWYPIKRKTNERKTGKLVASSNKFFRAKKRTTIMPSLAHATFPRVAPALLFLLLAAAPTIRADDLTGMLQDDPKDLSPSPTPAPQAACVPNYTTGFLPLPSWARGVVMPSLPDVLKPMGRKAVLTTPPVPAPQPLAPPKDTATPTVVVARPTVVAPTPAPTPALIAVSPFLDWIKANPQAASEQARQQATAYQAGAEANAAAAPGAAPGSAAVAPAAPYWMPPLVDAAPFGSGNTTGISAAIYSTPQR